jgi:hypothetical protein
VGLTSIKLSGGYRLTDQGLTQLTQLTMLQSIELNACPQLTKEGLKQVALVNQCLTRLVISRCPRLAQDMAEAGCFGQPVFDQAGHFSVP